MESKHLSRRTGLPFLVIGTAFVAASFVGPSAFLGVGMALVGLGLATSGIAFGQRPRHTK